MNGHSERRLVTCLFVDIVGSTETTVRLAPEQAQRLLGEAFDRLSSIVVAEGGIVEKYIGDAIFAVFGAPTAHADDAVRALRAAQQCIGACAAQASPAGGLAVRIGVETGEALVDLDAVEARQRIAVGACVNAAARLQQQAEPGQILVGPGAHAAAGGRGRFERGETLNLKGIGELTAWSLVEILPADPLRVPFVGRTDELRVLADAVQRARAGAATLALVIGPPGQGKSRLAAQAIAASAPRRLIEARCRPGTEAGSNTPLRQLLAADVPDATLDATRARLSELLGEREGMEVAAAVCHAAGVAPDERLLAQTRLEQRDVIAGAWRRYMVALAGEELLVVSVEDVHWADPVLLRVIDVATTDVQAPVLVLGTARPELLGSPSLRPRPDRIQIELEPLGPVAAARLARLAGGDHDGSGAERAAGNPLFIIELARAGGGSQGMPVTIQAAIAARLDELAPAERDLLQRVSVVGEAFEIHDAALLAETDPGSVAAALGRMVHLGFVVPIESRFRFHHVLVRDVAYGRLPLPERMGLHARYAADGLDRADVEAQAHHWWEALGPPEALWVWNDAIRLATIRRGGFEAHLAAERRLTERNAYEDALQACERALALADEPESAAEAEAAMGSTYAKLAQGDEAWQHGLRAIQILKSSKREVPAERYLAPLAIAAWNWGYFQQFPDALEVLSVLDDAEAAARAQRNEVALAELVVGRARFTDDLAGTEEIEALLQSPHPERFADAGQRLAQLYLWEGQVERALELYRFVFDDLLPRGAVINELEALLWYSLSALQGADVEHAAALAGRLVTEAVNRSAHTRQHGHGIAALVALARGALDEVASNGLEVRRLAASNPGASFCLWGSSALGYQAIAEILAGRPLPPDLDEQVARLATASPLIQKGSVIVPKVMNGDAAALDEGLAAYAPGIALGDRQRTLDVSELMPAIARTMLERWNELDPMLERMDALQAAGGRLAGAVAAAIREEREHARGGPPPSHAELHRLGLHGMSMLLRFRPG